MHPAHLSWLCCPSCRAGLKLRADRWDSTGRVESGLLLCEGCPEQYPIVRSIPRFVSNDNYAASFGLEWTRHARTQYDSQSGTNLSEKRFFEETGWPRRMEGEVILEAGSGSGRFTEQAANTGAMVVSFDLSVAVEVNHATNGARDNVLIVQADIRRIPCRSGAFDKVFCFGVLQHTPDPRGAFMCLPEVLRPGGTLVVDVYAQGFVKEILATKYWVRTLIRNKQLDTL